MSPIAVDEADPYRCTGYRLPTEAEWEYAARAGVDTEYSGSDVVGDIAWCSTNSGSRPHAVSTKAANAWDLYDRSGNKWEWANDMWNGSTTCPGDATDPVSTGGSCRVVRGGNWYADGSGVRGAGRGWTDSAGRYGNYGLRLSRSSLRP